MRQLDSCDFCGEPPEGVFEVVPASVAGEARRLALCADCRATLQSVTDPLLDAARGSSDEQSGTEQAATPATRAEAKPPSGDAFAPDTVASTDDGDESGSATTVDDGVTIDANDDAAASSDGTEDPASSDDAADAATDDESTERKPDGYAKVVRLLQNRDGAMARDDLQALATNAYDLSASTFRDAVDAAIENGDLTETSDGLRTT